MGASASSRQRITIDSSLALEYKDAVRALKEKGLDNSDPEVQAAVEILLERKGELEALEEKYDAAPG